MYEIFRMFEYPLVVLLLLICIIKGSKKNTYNSKELLISMDVSNLLKAICCVVIVLVHYASKNSDYFFEFFLKSAGENAVLPIFFILSAYGITKSELKNSITTFGSYCKKRLMKITIPLVLVVAFFETFFAFFSVDTTRCYDVYWFIWVIYVVYILFYVAKKIFPLKNKKNQFFLLFSFSLVLIGLVAYLASFPAHYYRHLWSIILGIALAVYEKKIIDNKRVSFVMIFFLCFFWTLFQSFVLKDSRMFSVYICSGLIVLFLSQLLLKDRCVKCDSVIAKIGTASYEVYLVHMFVLLFVNVFLQSNVNH